METSQPTPVQGVDVFNDMWDSYTKAVKPRIKKRAEDIAKTDERTEILETDALDAIREYLPGKVIDKSELSYQNKDGWINRNVSGFIGTTFVLTVVFGVLGLAPFIKDNPSKDFATVASGFLEIAKIFAGALVGGAAGVAATSARK